MREPFSADALRRCREVRRREQGRWAQFQPGRRRYLSSTRSESAAANDGRNFWTATDIGSSHALLPSIAVARLSGTLYCLILM